MANRRQDLPDRVVEQWAPPGPLPGGLVWLAVFCALVVLCCLVWWPRPSPPAPDPRPIFDRRAEQVIAAWRTVEADRWPGTFVPLQGLTVPLASELSSNAQDDLFRGSYRTAIALSGEQPAPGTIRFADATTLDLPLVSAATAYDDLNPLPYPPCPFGQPASCTGLTVTAVTLGAVSVPTSRGPASAPAWLFSFDGLPDPVARVAVGPAYVRSVPEPGLPRMEDPDGWIILATHAVLRSAPGTRVDYLVGVSPCETGVEALVRETDDFVVLGASREPPPRGQGCAAVIERHPVSVTLRSPLGTRTILDAVTGRPPIYCAPAAIGSAGCMSR